MFKYHFSLFTRSPYPDEKRGKELSPDEEERQKLRDVEVKVMRFIDKLEQRGGSKSGLDIQKEASKFREQLLQVGFLLQVWCLVTT